jgi:glutamate-1-semialdehyde 2,1-aminomutase/spore coat polysaccharide biosynthesis protein SpsF
LRDQYNVLADALGVPFTRCVGFGCRTMLTFAPQGIAAGADPLIMKSFVQQELIRRGILWSGFHNLSAAHTPDDLGALLGAYREILPELRAALERGALPEALRGAPVEPVFRRTSNFNMKPRPAAAKDGARARA